MEYKSNKSERKMTGPEMGQKQQSWIGLMERGS